MSLDGGSSCGAVRSSSKQQTAGGVADLLKERRRILRQRLKLLLDQLPAIPADGGTPLPDRLPIADSIMNREAYSVVASELQRIAWDPVMELAHLVFCVCRAAWDRQHQQSMEAVRHFHVHVAARRSGGDAWERLLAEPDPIDGGRPVADAGSSMQVQRSVGLSSGIGVRETAAPGRLVPANRPPVGEIDQQDLLGDLLGGRVRSTARDASVSTSSSQNTVVDSDEELDMRVALKFAERRAAARATVSF